MVDIPEGAFALSDLKHKLDAALIVLETRYGLNHDNPDLMEAREAGDNLFKASIQRKFNLLEPRFSYREVMERGR